MSEELIKDLSFRFKVDLAEFKRACQEAQQMVQSLKGMMGNMGFGGGGSGGGGGGGMSGPGMPGNSVMPTTTAGLNAMPGSNSNVTERTNQDFNRMQQQHAVVQNAPRAAKQAAGQLNGSEFSMYGGDPILGPSGTPAAFGKKGGLSAQGGVFGGQSDGFNLGGMRWDAGHFRSWAAAPGVSPGAMPFFKGGPWTPGTAFGGSQFMQGGVAQDGRATKAGADYLKDTGGWAANFSPEDKAAAEKKTLGSVLANLPLRKLLFGTAAGLVATAVVGALAAESQASAGMMLAGSNQGQQSLIQSQKLRASVGMVPYAGAYLSAMMGVAGLDNSDAMVHLAQNQEAFGDWKTGMSFQTKDSLYQSAILRSGPNKYGVKELEVGRLEKQQQASEMATGKEGYDKWDAANPETTSTWDVTKRQYEEGRGGGAWYNPFSHFAGLWNVALTPQEKSTSKWNAERTAGWHERQDPLIARRDADRIAAASALGAYSRESVHDIGMQSAEVEYGRMQNRFMPGKAFATYSVSKFQTDANYRGYGMKPGGVNQKLLEGDRQLAINELEGKQRTAAETLFLGHGRQYNPYTQSTLGMMDRHKESTLDAWKNLGLGVSQVKAARYDTTEVKPEDSKQKVEGDLVAALKAVETVLQTLIKQGKGP